MGKCLAEHLDLWLGYKLVQYLIGGYLDQHQRNFSGYTLVLLI